jgi:hypothetical protein
MIQLPDMPPRIARLARDERGYPVPWFVQWMKDEAPATRNAPGAAPDFRYADQAFRSAAFKHGFCWVCGQRLGVHKVYVIGPMCVINRVTMEPACHRGCAEFTARACPFLTRPRQKRNEKGLPEDAGAPGVMIKRNPGCVCLYETPLAKPFNAGGGGWLIRLDAPVRVDWWAEGREATRAEVMASIESGYPILMAEAEKDGEEAIQELIQMAARAMKLLPKEEPELAGVPGEGEV